MGARKSGSTSANLRAKNAAMGVRMKAEGVERHTTKCPCCHNTVSLNGVYQHIIACKGRSVFKPATA